MTPRRAAAVLFAGAISMLSGCDRQPDPAPSPGDASSPPSSKAPDGVAPTASAVPDVSAAVFVDAEVGEMTSLPGLETRAFVAPLADAYARIDPSKDGWDTEAFHEAAGERLTALAHWLGHPENEEVTFSEAASVASTPWIGSPLETVFQQDGFVIRRGPEADAGSAAAAPTLPLAEAADAFRRQFAGASPKVKFKLYRIEPSEDRVRTRIRVEAQGEVPGENAHKKQIVAEWEADWRAQDETPVLLTIRVLSYEEATYAGSSKTLFADRTGAVLGGNASYEGQLLPSADHWRSRIPRDLGIDVVANHGLAMGDVNGDLLDDLYLCMEGGLPNRLYLRNPDGTLTDASQESGADWLDYCASALIADFNNDGHRDLVVGQEWRLLFMENDGNGRFDLAFGLGSRAQTFSLAVADYDGDGDLDLYACGYNPSADTVRQGAMGEPMPYHDARNGGASMLLRNDGNWEFTEVTDEAGLGQNNDRFSFAAAWEDFDNDGDLDLYVANDYGRNNLYRQDNGRFTDVADALGVEDMSSGMSVSWGDYNRDGWMDVYVSNMFSAAGNRITYQRQFKTGQESGVREVFQRHARGNSLFEGFGPGQFRDVSVERNATMGRWAWASAFVDLNNDGWQDLVVSNGFITAEDTGDL